MTCQQQISFSTTGHGHMHDLTDQITTITTASGIRTGLIHVFTIGSTAAITDTNKPGTTATAIPISKPRCSAPRSPSHSPAANLS